NYMFITANTYVLFDLAALGAQIRPGSTLNQQVLAGADRACANAAMASAVVRGSASEHWVAWLSDTNVPAISRLGTAQAWFRPDDKPFAGRWAAGTGPLPVLYPPAIDENGKAHAQPEDVLTETKADGTPDDDIDYTASK